MDQNVHAVWLDKMFDIIVEGHCRKCERPQKKEFEINYDNPLRCGCRCDDVKEPLLRAGSISEAIEASGPAPANDNL